MESEGLNDRQRERHFHRVQNCCSTGGDDGVEDMLLEDAIGEGRVSVSLDMLRVTKYCAGILIK